MDIARHLHVAKVYMRDLGAVLHALDMLFEETIYEDVMESRARDDLAAIQRKPKEKATDFGKRVTMESTQAYPNDSRSRKNIEKVRAFNRGINCEISAPLLWDFVDSHGADTNVDFQELVRKAEQIERRRNLPRKEKDRQV
jgi:hypothetical protein